MSEPVTVEERLADISAGIGRIAGERDECRRQLAAARADLLAELRAAVEGLPGVRDNMERSLVNRAAVLALLEPPR